MLGKKTEMKISSFYILYAWNAKVTEIYVSCYDDMSKRF